MVTLRRCLPLLAVVLLSVARPLAAQPTGTLAREDAFRDTLTQVDRIVRAFLDNDLFALRDTLIPTDWEYTHGVGATWYWADAPVRVRSWLGDVPGCSAAADRGRGCLMAMFGVRQVIFTPPSNELFSVPGQRPYTGFLGVAVSVSHVQRHRQRSLRLEVGTTGRPALGAPVQRVIHDLTGSRPELGWRNQLPARPALVVEAEEQWQGAMRVAGAHLRGRAVAGGQVGTVRTGAYAGTELQLAPDRRAFWTPFEGGAPLPLGPYLVAGARQELVVRDLFVDGHPGGRGTTARREPGVWQTTLGLGWRFAGGSTEYRHVRRGREYAAQPRPHGYGALVFTWYR
jgi:hypothetical protein